jgi:formaldehyde-activating enzyme involved in methanogenesis
MAKINGLCVGESLVGEGNEVAHIDLIMGPRGSTAETAFANCLTNNKDGFTSLLAVVAPNLLCKPATVLFNKVTIKGARPLITVTAVRVIVRIAIVGAVSIKASTKATALEVTVTETAAACREPVASETAVAHREPMASETATAKAVTSKTPAMASTTAMA